MIDKKACINFLIAVTLGSDKSRTALDFWIVVYQIYLINYIVSVNTTNKL